jgi:hypothetical protein
MGEVPLTPPHPFRGGKMTEKQEYQLKWREDNKEHIREYNREWRENHPEYGKEYRRSHPQHKKAKYENTEKRKQKMRGYRCVYNLKHPDKHRASLKAAEHKRRSRERGAAGVFTAKQWIALKVKYGSICLCCRKSENELFILGYKLVPDHVIALSVGGEIV